MDTSKLRPFNLEEALAGKPVVHKSGKTLLNFTRVGSRLAYTLEGDDDFIYQTGLGGTVILDCVSTPVLFMAPVQREAWVNLYEVAGVGQGIGSAYVFASQHLADGIKHAQLHDRIGGKAHHIQWEE